ncbi:uncharacterized protein LOC142571175 isoform X2 [Dermacentor variabilis]|uniref:uncharacterized protein LOC142571175 isoform X2 n=1 Tax=Dermacentor variabilis TaxID=34621 RepID=UPI003F5C60B3
MNALVLFHLLCVLAASADASKFEPCGKRPGLITSSKGAAVAAKFIEKCGKDIALGYPWNTTTLQKGTFSLTDEQMTSLTEQFQVCLLPDVLPKDARILLAMLRYLQKSLVFGST